MTRRELLEAVGAVGGGGAALGALRALGLAEKTGAAEAVGTAGTTFRLDGEPGHGRTVLILGAGLTGLCAAYELGRAGYDCRLLEARTRPGGRCHTIRRGAIERDTHGVEQRCRFDDGLYFNPGPARIPQHHVTLDYCRELGVAIEPFFQVNDAAYLYLTGGRPEPLGGGPLRMREFRSDLLGYTAELLAKALDRNILDAEVTAEDRARLRAYLFAQGELGRGGAYRGGSARGTRTASEGQAASARSAAPLTLSELLGAAPSAYFLEERTLERQPALFQIVGGTDNLARAFAQRLGGRVTYGAVVRSIAQTETGVTVGYEQDGKRHSVTAEYCVCTLPVPLLKELAGGFAEPVRAALAASPSYGNAGKVGLQFKRRFWEEDDRIFGGITRTDLPIGQIWYPSTGFLGKKGVLVGYYVFDPEAAEFAALTPEERIARALEDGSRIHGPAYREAFECGVSVAWDREPYSRGAWGRGAVPALQQPDGRVYFASADLTPLNGWMAGAFESARTVVRALHERAQKQKLPGTPPFPAAKGART